MIICRSPLRISIAGGGTDLPSYYREHSGFVIAAAIDKYVYLTLHRTFVDELIIKYSQMERVKTVDEIQHPIIRETLKLMRTPPTRLEIASMADIPAGTGLGSSGSFTTAFLKALHTLQQDVVDPRHIAEEACHIEIDILKEPIGKQDQYIAAYGGLTCFRFMPNHQVEVTPLRLDTNTLYTLEDNLLLFFTGYTRSASEILRDQHQKSMENNGEMIANLHFVKDLARQSREALEKGDVVRFGELMHVHWENKKQRSRGMTNEKIDEWYALARKNGAIGGKLIGAGGGGFLLLYAEDKRALRAALTEAGLREVRFRFDFEGTKVVTQS